MKETTNPERAKRLRETAVKYAVLLCLGVAYLILVQYTGSGIPCLFYEMTGLKCPGCGVTRMLTSLIKLDFATAFWHNPFLFVTGPFLIAYLVGSEIRYVREGSRRMGKWEILLWVMLVLLIAYGVLRNIFPI